MMPHRKREAPPGARQRTVLIVISILVCGVALSLTLLAAGHQHLIQGAEARQQHQQEQQQQQKQSNSSSIEHKDRHHDLQQQQQTQQHTQQTQQLQQKQQQHDNQQQQQQSVDQLLLHAARVVRAGAGPGGASDGASLPLKRLLDGRHDESEQPAASFSSSLLRAFIRTNNMRAYHLDLHTYRNGVQFAGDPSFVDSRGAFHVQRCRRHLSHYRALLGAFKRTDPMEMTSSLDSLRLADTFGRPGPGLLDGNQFWLGSYEGCLRLRDMRVPAEPRADDHGDELSAGPVGGGGASETVNSQYCVGLAQFPSWNERDTKTAFKVGMCLPETCTSSMLSGEADLRKSAEQMMKYQLGEGLPFGKLRLRSVYCLPHETSEVRQYGASAKLLLAVMSTFVVACLYATLSDYLNTKTTATPSIKLVAADGSAQRQAQQQQQQGREGAESTPAGAAAADATATASERVKLVLASEERTWRNVFVESFSLMRNFDKITTIVVRASDDARSSGSGSGSVSGTGNRDAQQDEGERARVDAVAANGPLFNRDMFFRCITGIKCIGLLWIIAAHTFLVGPITHNNLIQMDRLTKTYLANVYLTAHLIVDTFFALSGLLASYLIFSKGIHKFKLSHWVVMTVHRYWRLTPVYLICFWFAKSMGHLVNSGPLWDYMTAEHSPRLNCANESWLEALLHRSDFKSPKAHCVPFAWFIANGIKFWMITPLFLIAIHKSVRRGYALVCATILANIAIVFTLAINSPVDMKSVIEFKPESADNMLNDMEEIYTRPYSRVGAYLVGLLAGHWFHAWELQGQRMNLSEKAKIAIWSLVSVTMIVLAFVIKIADGIQIEESAIPWIFSFCSAIIRPLWALCTCWLVFALSHGQARWLASFVGARAWLVLAKLSFSAYLVQGEVIANLYLSQSHSGPYFYSDMVTHPLVASAATILAAFLMALFVEYPLIGIEELILPAKALKAAMSSNGNSKESEKSAKCSAAAATLRSQNGTQMSHDDGDDDILKRQTCDHNGARAPNGLPATPANNKLKEL